MSYLAFLNSVSVKETESRRPSDSITNTCLTEELH